MVMIVRINGTCRKNIVNFVLNYIYITTQTERKIRDRDQIAVFGGRKKRKGL